MDDHLRVIELRRLIKDAEWMGQHRVRHDDSGCPWCGAGEPRHRGDPMDRNYATVQVLRGDEPATTHWPDCDAFTDVGEIRW